MTALPAAIDFTGNAVTEAGFKTAITSLRAFLDENLSAVGGGKIGIGIANPDGTLHVHTASAGAVTASTSADDLVVENSGDGGISILVPDNAFSSIRLGGPNSNAAGRITYGGSASSAADTMLFHTNDTEKIRIDATGTLFIGDTANANMTIGLTINQGANDDEALAVKSSDVAHGGTDIAETDTFLSIRKGVAAVGGAEIRGLVQSAGNKALELKGYSGGDANTGKDVNANAIVQTYAAQLSGASLANIVADGNVFAVRARRGAADVTLFIVDEDGDLLADGGVASTDMVTLFDGEEDLALCRAFDLLRAEKGGAESQLIRTEWDDWASEHKGRLVKLGVLGADGEDGSRGLVNVTQLQRLHNGAIWQSHVERKELEQAIAETMPAIAARLEEIRAERKLALAN